MVIRPLVITNPNVLGSGASRRNFEVLKRAKEHGIEPVIMIPTMTSVDYVKDK